MRLFSFFLMAALLLSCTPQQSAQPEIQILSVEWVDDFDLHIAFSLENATSKTLCVPLSRYWDNGEWQPVLGGDLTLETRDGRVIENYGDTFGLEPLPREINLMRVGSGRKIEGDAVMIGDVILLESGSKLRTRVDVLVVPCDDANTDRATRVSSNWIFVTMP